MATPNATSPARTPAPDTTPVLTPADVTVTTDHMGRVYAIVPDTVARHLAIAARQGIDPHARGIDSESTPHPALSWTTTTVHTIFQALLTARPEDAENTTSGLAFYHTNGGGTFYGFIVGESGWDPNTHWWRDYPNTADLRVRGNATIAASSRPTHAGTCTF